MGFFPPVDANGHFYNGTSIDAMTKVVFPGAISAACYNLLAVVLFYAFRSNRKFPVVTLGWIGAVNTIYGFYLIAKWAPGTEAQHVLLIAPKTWSCFLEIWADHAFQTSICALNTVIAAVLFLSVVKRIEVDQNSKIYFGSLAFYWIYTLTVAFANAGPAGNLAQGYCVTAGPDKEYILIPYFVLLATQAVLVVLTIARVLKITKFARNIAAPNQKAKKRTRILTIRFSITMLSQALNISAYLCLAMSPDATASILLYACFGIITAMFIDGTVVLFLNRPLLKLVSTGFQSIGLNLAFGSSSLTSNTRGTSVQLEETPMNS